MAPPNLRSVAALALCLLTVSADDEATNLEEEHELLKQRLAALQTKLKEEEQFSYVVSKGMIVDAENVFMETMELMDAKQWCNSNPNCKGFTFLAPMNGATEPDDEVTVTFKGEPEEGGMLHTEPDVAYVSYIKHSAANSMLGAVGDAGMQLNGGSAYLVGQWLGFEATALIFMLAIIVVFACRHRMCKKDGLLPR